MKLPASLVNKQILFIIIAMAFSQLAVIVFPVRQGFWIPLTTLVVSLTINSSIAAFRRGFHRILGTILGVVFGGLLTSYFHNIDAFLALLVIFASIAYWTKCFQKLYYIFVFFITVVVVALLSMFFHDNKIVFTSMISTRIIDTIIGSFIAYFFAVLIMPHHQHKDVLRAMKKSLIKVFLTYKNNVNYLVKQEKIQPIDFEKPFIEVNNFINDSIPIWSYDLLLDRYIYSQFILFLHRIHKMIIILKLLNTTLQQYSEHITDTALITCLKENQRLFTTSIQHIINMKKDSAILSVSELHIVNLQLTKLALETNDDTLIQVSILLQEIENDLRSIIYGVAFYYLHDKSQEL